MPTVVLAPGFNLHYLDFNGPAGGGVLLLHGLGVSCESWQLQVPSLARAGFRVLVPDARGFGRSTYPGGSMTIAQMAEDMARLLQLLQAAPIHVVGISMGGTLALQLALDHPELIDRLVLVNTFACLRPDQLRVWLYFAMRFLLVHTLGLPVQARTVAKRLFPRPDQEQFRQALVDQVLQADPRGYRAAMRALARFDVRRRLQEVHAATLVITSEKDSTVPPKAQQILVEAIPNVRQVTISGAGHAVPVEKPELFNLTLLDFLAD